MSHKPAGFGTVTPYLIVEGASKWIDFVKAAFGAEELSRTEEEGRVVHGHLRIGDSMIEISDAREPWGPVRCALHVYVEDAGAVYAKAIAAGATSLYEPSKKPYGDFEGGVTDAWGNQWFIATHSGSWA
jgi:PhnB protein